MKRRPPGPRPSSSVYFQYKPSGPRAAAAPASRYTDRMVSHVTVSVSRVRPDRSQARPASRTKKDVVTEFRTAEILRAAGRVFAERGFERATIAEIARSAGVAKGTVYLYYPSKQHVYEASLRRSAKELAARTKTAMDQATGAGAKVRAFIATRLSYFEEHLDFFRIYNSEVGRAIDPHGPRAKPADDLCREPVWALEQVLRDAMRRKAIRAVRADAAASAILDITRGVVLRRLRGTGRAPLDEDITFAFDMAWKGIGHR